MLIFREIAFQEKDLESETAESRSRNGALFSLACDRNRTHSGLDAYEFQPQLVCALQCLRR